MVLQYFPKPSWDDFIKTCTPLAINPQLESEMRIRVEKITEALLKHQSTDDPIQNLASFLKADPNFLGIILALTNLSQEKFLRILSAERFVQADFSTEWGIKSVLGKLKDEAGFAERIAQLFISGRTDPLLVAHVAAFYLDQLSLPPDWNAIIRSSELVPNVVRRKLIGEYSDQKGDAIEKKIRDQLDSIQQKYGVPHGKGQVRLVRKEVDHIIPSVEDPIVMIMDSYMETTSSSQTERANEQSEMYAEISKENTRYRTKHILVNFVDGAGWLARRSDLRKMYDGCDYILNLKTLDRLEVIIGKYVPSKYFTVSSKPQVEGT